MAMQWIDCMAVEVEGEGPAVVMVHGLGGTTNTWTPLMPAFARRRAVRIELPGSGRSQRAHALESVPLTIDRLATAVLRVCGRLGVERAIFAGHSLGTIVCMRLAQREAALVSGLLLYGPLLAPPDPARSGLKQRAAKARAEGMFGIADTIVQSALSTSTRETQPVTVAMVRESLLAQDPEGYARTCEALSEAQAADIAPSVCPALLITGDEDPVAPAQNARAIAAKMADARVETLARCGHWTTFERAMECRELAADFLARLH
jgi:pimeloyl-ACP methyl ester carboxylesterase